VEGRQAGRQQDCCRIVARAWSDICACSRAVPHPAAWDTARRTARLRSTVCWSSLRRCRRVWLCSAPFLVPVTSIRSSSTHSTVAADDSYAACPTRREGRREADFGDRHVGRTVRQSLADSEGRWVCDGVRPCCSANSQPLCHASSMHCAVHYRRMSGGGLPIQRVSAYTIAWEWVENSKWPKINERK